MRDLRGACDSRGRQRGPEQESKKPDAHEGRRTHYEPPTPQHAKHSGSSFPACGGPHRDAGIRRASDKRDVLGTSRIRFTPEPLEVGTEIASAVVAQVAVFFESLVD